ncbi:AHH domain-containing protein [Thalassomonas sp. RHCl1]|uniref:AHH domain-containing protein n=1 Tax=Thalassomonas sp. RHCl1 TaxID=2995320 RepID=UPI00248CFCDF|nr:AHH domain-containing protein [Thalassomonas sp. RHCl1]
MEFGETTAITNALRAKNKCVICGKAHAKAKKKKIKKTAPSNSNWHRKSMSKVFEKISAKTKIYPDNAFPPPYAHQGHHCLALSAFTENSNSSSPTDKNVTLNFYLDEVGFYPNRQQNCIGLPALPAHAAYDDFWKALDYKKPLQMHGQAHDESYFTQCRTLLARLRAVMSRKSVCEKKTEEQWKKKLEQMISQAENYAFTCLAAANMPWRLHPVDLRFATKLYFMPLHQEAVLEKDHVHITGYGRGEDYWQVRYPKVNLDTGDF